VYTSAGANEAFQDQLLKFNLQLPAQNMRNVPKMDKLMAVRGFGRKSVWEATFYVCTYRRCCQSYCWATSVIKQSKRPFLNRSCATTPSARCPHRIYLKSHWVRTRTEWTSEASGGAHNQNKPSGQIVVDVKGGWTGTSGPPWHSDGNNLARAPFRFCSQSEMFSPDLEKSGTKIRQR
jgi:hypothetical protein